MKRILIVVILFCFGTALCLDANAKGRKQATTTPVIGT